MTDTTDPNDPRWMAFVAWAQRRWGKEAWHHTINTCGEWDAWNGALEQQAHAAKVASDMAEIRERVIAHQKDIIRDQAAQIEALQLTKAGLIGSLREEMDEGLRLRELGGALPNENITAMTERLIGERAALAAELSARRADAELKRDLLLWALYHAQGGSSRVGQAIRRHLGIEQHARLTPEQIKDAERAAQGGE